MQSHHPHETWSWVPYTWLLKYWHYPNHNRAHPYRPPIIHPFI
jgi:hypothetical protein